MFLWVGNGVTVTPVTGFHSRNLLLTEQPAAYETVDLPDVPKHSDRFYEQWFVCRNGHRKRHISGHGRAPGIAKVVSETSVITVRA
jgi:hypothetical protein